MPNHDQKRRELLDRAKKVSQEITEKVRGLVGPDVPAPDKPAEDDDTSEMTPIGKTAEQPSLPPPKPAG